MLETLKLINVYSSVADWTRQDFFLMPHVPLLTKTAIYLENSWVEYGKHFWIRNWRSTLIITFQQ